VSGKSWEEFTGARILKPLGMTSTVFTVAEMRASPDHAVPYRERRDSTELFQTPFYAEQDGIAPAGAIVSNIEDMSKWLRLLLNDRRKLRPVSDGIDFLGYIVRLGMVRPASGLSVFPWPWPLLEQVRQWLGSYLAHFERASSHRLIEGLRSRFDWLDEYFVWKETSVEFRCPCAPSRAPLRATEIVVLRSPAGARAHGEGGAVRREVYRWRIGRGHRGLASPRASRSLAEPEAAPLDEQCPRGLDRRDRTAAGEHRRARADTEVGCGFVMSTGQLQ
jgi:hypothetical protein